MSGNEENKENPSENEEMKGNPDDQPSKNEDDESDEIKEQNRPIFNTFDEIKASHDTLVSPYWQWRLISIEVESQITEFGIHWSDEQLLSLNDTSYELKISDDVDKVNFKVPKATQCLNVGVFDSEVQVYYDLTKEFSIIDQYENKIPLLND